MARYKHDRLQKFLISLLVIVGFSYFGYTNLSLAQKEQIGAVLGQATEIIPKPITDKLSLMTDQSSDENSDNENQTNSPQSFTDKLSQQASELSSSVSEQTEELTSKVKDVGKHVGNVVNPNTNDENQTPLPERAWEYSRYLYCQGVTTDYENQYQ